MGNVPSGNHKLKPCSGRACAELAQRDPVMARLVQIFGPLELTPRKTTTFGALSRMIIGQQLSSKAAATIFGRFEQLIPGADAHNFQAVADMEPALLRSVGLSGAKARYVRELAQAAAANRLPELHALRKLEDLQIRETLLQFNGIGSWTVEMFEIFVLGKPDVLSLHDAGLRRGFELAYQRLALSRKGLAAQQKLWSPFCSTASLYLWKVTDNPTQVIAPKK